MFYMRISSTHGSKANACIIVSSQHKHSLDAILPHMHTGYAWFASPHSKSPNLPTLISLLFCLPTVVSPSCLPVSLFSQQINTHTITQIYKHIIHTQLHNHIFIVSNPSRHCTSPNNYKRHWINSFNTLFEDTCILCHDRSIWICMYITGYGKKRWANTMIRASEELSEISNF